MVSASATMKYAAASTPGSNRSASSTRRSTGTADRRARPATAGRRPTSVRIAGWIPRASSRSSSTAASSSSEASSRSWTYGASGCARRACSRACCSVRVTPIRRCWAPSWRSRSIRRRSASPAATSRVRDARTSSSCARTVAVRRAFSRAKRMTDTVAAISPVSSLRLRSWTIAPRSPSGPASTVATRSTSGWSSGGSAGWPVTSTQPPAWSTSRSSRSGSPSASRSATCNRAGSSTLSSCAAIRATTPWPIRIRSVPARKPRATSTTSEMIVQDATSPHGSSNVQQPLAGAHEHDQLEGVVRRHDGSKRTRGDDRSQDPAAHRPGAPQSQQRQRRDTEGGDDDDRAGRDLQCLEQPVVADQGDRAGHPGAAAVHEQPGRRPHDEGTRQEGEDDAVPASQPPVGEREREVGEDDVVVALEGEAEQGERHQAAGRVRPDRPQGPARDEQRTGPDGRAAFPGDQPGRPPGPGPGWCR